MQLIEDKQLILLIKNDLRDFISLSAAMTLLNPLEIPRSMLGRLLLESSKCEELLDAYDAPRNKYWSSIRMSVAIAKTFSRVAYNLYHIRQSSKGYHLLRVDDNFSSSTNRVLLVLLKSFIKGSKSFVQLAHSMDLNHDLRSFESYDFQDNIPLGKLKSNHKKKTLKNPQEKAVYLATSMLNLIEESTWLDIYKKVDHTDYPSCIPDVLSEEGLRHLSNNFHSLQSLYDTYLSDSDITRKDGKLPVMRGHITVVFHLLDTAVILTHFYERHTMKPWDYAMEVPISNEDLLEAIFGYFIAFSDKYIIAAQELCRDVLKLYAVQGKIEVPIPNYRGFHVRPSTLIAKIATHYGSEIKMMLGENSYDASLPLELFRVNEELNRRKRNAISRYIMDNKLVKNDASTVYPAPLMKKILRIIFLDLLEKQKIMLYDNDFSFEDLSPYENENLAEFIKRAIALYLAMGKIDIVSGDTVSFQGDKRVLEDIKILALNGYGEDKFGNNIVLPNTLSYLKR